MKRMNLLGVAALLLVLLLSFTACGGQAAPASSQPESSEDMASSQSPDPASQSSEQAEVDDSAATEAGVFSIREGRPTVDPSASFEANRETLNTFMEKVFGLKFFDNGIGEASGNTDIATFLKNEDGRLGLCVYNWRTDSASDEATNKKLNVVLEAIYFLCGDQDVAKSLWNLVDGVYINGTANTDEQGFENIGAEGNTYRFGKNGIQVEWVNEDVYTFWISKY